MQLQRHSDTRHQEALE